MMPYVLLIPVILIWGLTKAVPLIMAAWLSLQKTDYIISRFTGLKNYVTIFTDPAVVIALKNTLIYEALIVVPFVAFALFMALLISDLNKKVQHVARFFVYLPNFVCGIIIANSWKWIFHPKAGLVNWLLSFANIEPVRWWTTAATSILPISMIQILTASGGCIVLFLATLTGIDKQLIEAAKMDGASEFQMKRFIKLPIIAPTIALLSMLAMIGTMQIFEWIYMLAPYTYASTITYQIYHHGFLYGRPGMAAAQSMILFALIAVLTVIQKRLQKWQF